jgi:ribonuclease HI
MMLLASSDAAAQMMYADPGMWSSAPSTGVDLYPFDQQDTWIHGHFQRYPSYGGYASFRPYNYKHVAAQSQIAGGWGVRLQAGQHVQELFGGELNTTNNRMEMMAVIEGLLALKRPCQVTLYLDSEYVRKGITEWIHGWKARGWRTAAKQPVKNADLWQKLDSVVSSSGHQIDWRWVKGHNGDPGNERADALANQGVEKALGR